MAAPVTSMGDAGSYLSAGGFYIIAWLILSTLVVFLERPGKALF